MSDSSEQHYDESDTQGATNLWEIDRFDEIANPSSWDNASTKELQHIIATHSALLAVYDTYRKVYHTTFDIIHDQLVSSPGKIKKSVAFSQSIYHSLPTPLEELKDLTTKSIESMRDSGRFPHFDFENLEGNLNITKPTEEMDETELIFQQSRADSQKRKQEAFTNFQADDEQTAKSRESLSRNFALKETINNQRDSEISPLYERKASPTIPMKQ